MIKVAPSFFPNFIRVSFPFRENKFQEKTKEKQIVKNNDLSQTQKSIITLIEEKPTITQIELANLLDINIRTIQRNIKELIDLGIIERIGATKKGKWIVK